MTQIAHPLRKFFLISFIFLGLLAGCSSQPQSPPEGVVSFLLDPSSGVLHSVSLGLPSRFTEPHPPLFYMKTAHGTTTTWRPTSVLRVGASATVAIEPIDGPPDVRPRDSVLFYFYEPGHKDPNVMPAAFVPASAAILNGNFAQWTESTFPNPLWWPAVASDGASYDVHLLNEHGGVRISVAITPIQRPGAIATPIPGSTPTVLLSQSVSGLSSHLRVIMRPFEPCTISHGRITAATGIQLAARSGAAVLFCLGNAAFSGNALIDGRTVALTVLRGKIGDWNDVSFDIRSAIRALGPPPLTISLIAQVDAIRSPYDWVTMDVSSIANEP